MKRLYGETQMSDFWMGFAYGAFALLVVIILVALMGCDSALDVMVEPGVVNKVEEGPPGRPPLPEGWRADGDLWVNDITRDTM